MIVHRTSPDLIIFAPTIGSGGTVAQLNEFLRIEATKQNFENLYLIGRKKHFSKLEVPDRVVFINVFSLNFLKLFLAPFLAKRDFVAFLPGGIGYFPFCRNVLMVQTNLPFEAFNWNCYGFSFRLKQIFLRYLILFFISLSDNIITNTKHSRNLIEANAPKFLQKKISMSEVISLGLSRHFISSMLVKKSNINDRSLGSSRRIFKFVYPSSLEFYKNHELVIDVLNHFQIASASAVQLYLISQGDSKRRVQLENYVASRRNSYLSVFFLENLDAEQVVSTISNCDFGLFASSCESFGLSLLEMIACGLPCLCEVYPGFVELYPNCVEFVSFNDTASASDRLLLLVNDGQRQTELAKIGQEFGTGLHMTNTCENITRVLMGETP